MPEVHVEHKNSRSLNVAQADLVRRGVENIRRRLLDLTNRNKLISFRHGKSSLRIVDVDLDGVYQSLLDEKKFPFVYVPEPTREQIAEIGERPSAKDFAEQLGWATEFDLIDGVGQSAGLPVLHYQEDFETIIRKIGTTARTAIEESGANLLHLVFGFLEWRESDDSTQIRQAPLLVVPVWLITPKAQEADRSIRLLYTGEDLTTNLSLVEKMRRDFGIDIPCVEEDETPEKYYQRFSAILEQKRDWRICRQVSLALLSFGKLLMYLDLDADRWPANSPLIQHPRLLDMFSGSSAEGLSFATEFDIDEEAIAGEVPPLICDADSSQHSALIDAARGKNLVIEGPPGTGKSQTITNLIAASIAKGKRVLFVAEKMAALDVVKRRLDTCGLGDFCLELHSHKTSKVGLLKSLENRIQASNRYSTPTTLAQKQGLLDNKRIELTKYVSLLNTPYAAIGKTPFELIWQRDSLSDLTAPALREMNGIAFPEAFGWNYQSLQERKDMVSTYAAHLRRMAEAGGRVERKENDWGWLPDGDLSLSDQHRLLASLPPLRASCEQRIAIIDSLSRTVSEQPIDVTEWLGSVDQWPAALPKADAGHLFEALGVLSGMEQRAHAEGFLNLLNDFEELLSTLPGGSRLLDSTIVSQFLAQDNEIRALGLADYSIDGLQAMLDAFIDTEKHVERAKKAAAELSQGLGVRASFTLRCVTNLIAGRHLLESAPLHLAHLRGPQFAKDGLGHLLQMGQKESATAISDRDALSENFVVDSSASAVELDEAAAVLDGTPWYGRLGKSYRRSALLFNSHCHTVGKRTRSQKAACLRYLAQNRRKIDEFTNRPDYRSQLGENFSGLTTNWEDLM
jgi:hypothetical protein